ncbi:MAG: cytochrome C oxidase subunit IV family protein [bacterium]|nr:cytochrome C oxidase subunit IV family protein [bacterium]
MSQHISPKSTYFTIFGALLVLTGVTVWVAFLDLGALNTVVALTIAVIKATLVVLWFMHVIHSNRLTWVFAGAGFVWLILLIGITMCDFISRDWLGIPVSEFLNP